MLVTENRSKTTTLAKSKQVKQTYKRCKVTVIGGDQITTNETTNVYNKAIRTHEAFDREKLIKTVNVNADERSSVRILDDFKHDGLQETGFVVYPQMRMVDVDTYYKGRYERDVAVQNQLINEVGFSYKDGTENKPIQINEVMASIWQKGKLEPSETVGITAIVASAGSGKTTLTRRLARKALGLSSGKNKNKQFKAKKMVHYIELKDVKDENDIKPSKFLFGGLFLTESEEDQAFEWLDENQSDATLFLDGLDQARFTIYDRDVRNIRKHERDSTWTILYNILARNILRHVKIFITSREFRISELPQKARPHDIIMLHGFTLPDAQGLFTSLLGENGVFLWESIERMSPRLLHIISQPVFLILTAIVMGKDPRRSPPATITELYDRIIAALEDVENIRKCENISSVVNKLKEMSFQGMQEGRVIFNIADLEHYELSADDVKDLMAKVPGENLLSRRLMQGDFVFFFCHQSIQEYLAARFVAEMEIGRFRDFDKEHLHEERWSVVRRFVTGVVYMETPSNLVKDGEEKKKILADSIHSQLDSTQNDFAQRYIRLELYTSIYESNCADLIKGLSVINASSFPLSRDEAHIVGSLTARSDGLDDFNFCNCNMTDELMKIITRSMEDRPVRPQVVKVVKEDTQVEIERESKYEKIITRSMVDGRVRPQVVKAVKEATQVEIEGETNYEKIITRSMRDRRVRPQVVKVVKEATQVEIERETKSEKTITRSMEDRRVRVGNVDLRQNSLSSKTLRPFLGYHGSESKMGYFDWNVAQVRVKSHNCSITLKNERNSITIDGNTKAIYDKEQMALHFNEVHMLDVVVFFGQLFEPASIKLNCDQQLYATPDDLRDTYEIELQKIDGILLDFTKERVDWSSIKSSVERYHLKQLDVAVTGNNFTSDEIPDLGILVNIHRMFRAKDASDFKSILEASQQNEVGLLRCILEYHASIDDLRSLTTNCNPRVLTLVYEKSEYKHSEKALETIEVNSSGQKIKMNIIEHNKRTFDIWWYLDSGLMNKRSEHHHHHHHQHQPQHETHRHFDKHHHHRH